jgi:hypothetical protein
MPLVMPCQCIGTSDRYLLVVSKMPLVMPVKYLWMLHAAVGTCQSDGSVAVPLTVQVPLDASVHMMV